MRVIQADATEILPGLWQGDQFSGAAAVAEGFDMNVNLTPHTTNASMPALPANYIVWPISDGPLPDIERAFLIARRIAAAVMDNKRVMVHCAAGLNRSGLVMALAVREILRISGKDALELVRSRREGALFNENFAAYLRSLPKPKGRRRK